ncbi:pirin family protein [Weeksella virosa]|uniref:pirin family protein n=1 Tax=Weeksella virosa TaxID=1014 RepID=UPI000E0F9A1D|nr:pirin family protein [Weeksella virosa]
MKYQIYKAETRGRANHGWLITHHSYSFANYYQEDRIHFGALRVLNDDVIAAGTGFGRHPHENMEIITLPQKGALRHEDSMGNGSVIYPNDIQVMSAGTGIFHAEMNASETEACEIFQIWIFPNKQNVAPRYEQKSINDWRKDNQLYQILSPNQNEIGVWIHQDAWMYQGEYSQKTHETYSVYKENQGVMLFVIEGKVEFDGIMLNRRDAIEITDAEQIVFDVEKDSKILLIEVPLIF